VLERGQCRGRVPGRQRVSIRWLPVLLGLVVFVGPAMAQEPDVFRPCRRADLIGVWRVVRFGFAAGASVDRTDPAYRPHQRYVFNSNATMAYTASEAPPTPEQHRALLLAPAAVTWALDASGRLMRQPPGAVRVETSECRVITRAVRDPKSPVPVLAGDVLLTDHAEDARPVARRLLRKLEADE
jgi:hypothetical protein